MVTYCHVECKEGISHKHKHVGSAGTLGPIAKGEDEAHKEEPYIGIPKNHIEHFDRVSTNDCQVLEGICQDKERDEEVALDNVEQDKSGCKPNFDQVGSVRSVYVLASETSCTRRTNDHDHISESSPAISNHVSPSLCELRNM
jgi:hypothetical protein